MGPSPSNVFRDPINLEIVGAFIRYDLDRVEVNQIDPKNY